MTLLEALALGVVQGATEFLPVSSDGHLILARTLLAGGEQAELLFDVVVHLGTLLATVVVLRRRVRALLLAAWRLPLRFRGADSTDLRWLGLIAIACVPTAAIGLALRDSVVAMQTRPVWAGVGLLCTAVLLVAAERFGSRSRGPAEIGWADAFVIGVAQGLAVFPGLSRSGATVAAALSRNVRGDAAVEFSMMISLPAILGANLLEGSRAGMEGLASDAAPLAVGFLAAFAVGALSLGALRWVVVQRRLLPFALYCLLAGLGTVALA